MKCAHTNQKPLCRRLIGGIERVIFQCQDCSIELIYEEPSDPVPTFTATIYVGLRRHYDGQIADKDMVVDMIQAYVDAVGLGVTVTDTQFVYTNGREPGLAVGLINYPRFPSTPEHIRRHALAIADMLLKGCEQYRVTVVMPDETIMLSADMVEESANG